MSSTEKISAGEFAPAVRELDALLEVEGTDARIRSRLYCNRAFCNERLGLKGRAIKVGESQF